MISQAPAAHVCAACGETAATLGVTRQEFRYGSGDAAPTLHADVPVWSCGACGMEYVDSDGEALQHAAVCLHLGRLNPDQIRSVRTELGLSQKEFADKLLCGIASVKRWETGVVIQNAGIDARMRELAAAAPATPQPTFRSEFSLEQLRRAAMFRLRPCAMAA